MHTGSIPELSTNLGTVHHDQVRPARAGEYIITHPPSPMPFAMPMASINPFQAAHRDSWPPTRVPLYRSIEVDDNGGLMDVDHHGAIVDDDPASMFLTPIPLLDDGDTDDDVMDMDLEMDLDFDAGIEDAHRPSPIVRSISPSKLMGRPRPPPPRTPTPPHLRHGSYSPPSRNSPEVSTPSTDVNFDEDDDDGEDYVRFSPGSLSPGSPFRLAVPTTTLGGSKSRGSKARKASKTAAVAAAKEREKEEDRVALMMARGSFFGDDDGHLLPSAAFHVGRSFPTPAATRGRSTTANRPHAPHMPTRPRSWSGASGFGSGRLSPRAWREPSPDVWSIEEDVVGEVMSEIEMDVRETSSKKGNGKRVRFALHLREEIP